MENEYLVECARDDPFCLRYKSPRDPRILEAMSKVDRANYIPQGLNPYLDLPVSIWENQTCSQPSLVACMNDILEIESGMNILEIGTGGGYHAANTFYLLEDGNLISIEYIPFLATKSRENLKRQFGKTGRLVVTHGDGSLGWGKKAPYDRIYLTAGVDADSFNPQILARQLNPLCGILLFPEKEGSLIKQIYINNVLIEEIKYGSVYFVPLVGKNS